MAQNNTLEAAVAEAQGYFFDKVAGAPLLQLPGIDMRTGTGDERIDLIHPTINLTAGRKGSGALSTKTSSELFSQNMLSPAIHEEFFEIPLHAIQKTSVGQYGGNEAQAFLENTPWLSEMYTNYLSKLDIQVEMLAAAAINTLGTAANSADTTYDFNRVASANAPTIVSPTTQAIAWENINDILTFVERAPENYKTGGGNKVLCVSQTIRDRILRSFAIADARQLEAVNIEGNINAYQLPYTDTLLVGVHGFADTNFTMFDTNNLVVKMAADFKSDYFDRNDELWVRARVWFDMNFAFYDEVTTTLAQ